MATIKTVALKDIRYGGEIPENMLPLKDGDAAPIIAEEMTGKDGTYYDLTDGYHRLGGLIAAGQSEVTVIVPTTDEYQLCREFGGDEDAMSESEWIQHIQEIAE